MLNRSARESLKTYRAELEGWRQAVPRRAERFHRRLDALAGDVDQLLDRFWPRKNEVQMLEQRGERLRQVAGGLPRLCEDAEALAKKLADLREPEGLLAEELGGYFAGRRQQWASQIESLGRHVERSNALAHEEGVVGVLREELRRASESLAVLREAQGLLTGLPEAKTLAFHERLPGFADRLRAGPSEEWLADLRRELLPLKEAEQQSRNPPRVIQDVFHMLSELRSWARHFGREQEVARMEERRRNLALDWAERDPKELEELRREVEEARLRFFEEAREERQRRLRRLEEEMEDFFAVCDRQGDLEERLEDLRRRHRAVTKPQDYPGWIQSFEEADTFFKAIAENYQASLVLRLEELHARLVAGLEEVRRQPLSEAARQEAASLEYEAGRLQGLRQIEDVLRGLRQSQDLERGLEELHLKARQESEELAARKAQLSERRAALRRAAAALRTDVPEATFHVEEPGAEPKLHTEIKTLDEAGQTLEEAREETLGLEERLAAEERRFAVEGLAAAAGLEAEISRKLVVLRRAGHPLERPEGRKLDEGSTPAEVAAGLAAVAALERTLDARIVRALAELEGRRREQWEALQAVSLEGLGPGDRADVEQVREVFQEDLEAALPDPGERLARLLDLLGQAEALFQQLRQEEIEAQERHRSLLRRFRELKDDQLRRYAPQLADRLEGLIHGIPDPPRRWRDVREQLRGAEVLLDRLERYARRQAARELARDLEVLEKVTGNGNGGNGNGGNGNGHEEAAALLAEVRALKGLRLPPALLRMKVRRAARRHHGGDST